MKQTADVVIIGGGVMGCSILYNLAIRGVTNTILLEREVLGSGSTGRSQAICRTHYSNPVTATMAWESLKAMRDFPETIGGPSGFVQTGYFVVVDPEERDGLEANVDMQRSLGINTTVVSVEDVLELAPMLDVANAGGIAYEPESGYADPYAVTSTYARSARELGAEVQMQVRATGIEVAGGRVTAVTTSKGKVETRTVIVAAGPWSRPLLQGVGVDLPLLPVRHQIIHIQRPWDILPHHPTVADISQEISFRPDSDRFTLIGTGEEEADAENYNQGFDLDPAAAAFAKAAQRMPALAQGYLRGGWSGLFTVTPDWHPILDRLEGIDGLFCAVGFSGHGFKMSPMVGVVMAELVVNGETTSIDIKPLRQSRFAEGDLVRSRYRYAVLA